MSRNLDWKERWNAALREQHREFFDYQTKSLKPEYGEYIHCPVCASPDVRFLFEKDWFRYVQCRQCSMVYMNPRMNRMATHAFYNSNVNAIYNETKFDQVSNSTRMDDQINLENLEQIDRFRHSQKGNLLEIGSAKGFFLSKARERGYAVYGLELNQENYRYSYERLGNCIRNVDLLEAHFEDHKFDVVYMRDVIEHILEPKLFLQEISRVTKSGGLLFLDTHNVDGWIYKIVGGRHTVFFGFEHPVHWSPRTLGNILGQSGFIVRRVVQSSLDFTIADILNYFMMPGFTTIYPKSPSRWVRFLIKNLRKPFRLKFVRWLDQNTLPPLANSLGHGSTMKVMAEKVK